MNKVVAIIQARMGSTRLGGKVMLPLFGKSVLEHDIERLSQSLKVDEIVVATTDLPADDEIESLVTRLGFRIFRGSSEDVLSRYYWAARESEADFVVRITSDCPLLDPHLIDDMVSIILEDRYDIVTNATADPSQRTYPRGLDVEVFTFKALESAYEKAVKTPEREHVTPYIYANADRIYIKKDTNDNSEYRVTLDTEDDFVAINAIYSHLYKGKHDFYLDDILKLLRDNPDIVAMNSHIEQKKI